ncbi:hypothetical protein C943_00436 [Mariniradius saccharolyticus AK6]|uniref:Uncharacterized protein n=1 Tax=Mariniradius saccharolyticus AK6 TaxID=1239962 RepID=M7XE46_9BACT|nr:hypothetical protein C943_00436 [Mariniradius saccharolyticus AK6]
MLYTGELVEGHRKGKYPTTQQKPAELVCSSNLKISSG